MKTDCIMLLDSGYGGMNLLALCAMLMPDQNFLYVMDDANCPYGNKTKEEIETIVTELVTREVASNACIKLVVLACNTATACAADKLRSFCTRPVVGIEPATKPALKSSNETDKILVLCTHLTRKYAKSIIMAEKQAPDKLLFYTSPRLAKMIDTNITHLDDLLPWLSKALDPYKYENITKVVLGCTHYSFLQPQIQILLGHKVVFYPSENATAVQAMRLAQQNNLTGSGQITFRSTGNVRVKKMKQVYAEHFAHLFD